MKRKASIKVAILIIVILTINVFAAASLAVDNPKIKGAPKTVHKQTFWDLGILKICVQDQCYFPATDSGPKYVTVPINVHTVSIGCWAKYSAPGKAAITQEDAAYWGSGKFSYVIELAANNLNYSIPSDCGSECRKQDKVTQTIPPFTYEQAQTWSPAGTSFGPVGGASIRYLFTESDVGKTFSPSCYVYPVGWHEGGPDLSNQGVRYPQIRVGEVNPIPKSIGDVKSTTKVK